MSLKVGIVGTGWVTGLHVESIKKIEDVQIRAICGRNVSQAEKLVAGTEAKIYDDWRKMLDKERLDAVFILLPPHLHGELEVACAQCVKGVLIEKPVCNDLPTAQRIGAVFEKAGTIVSVGYMNRYRRTVERARNLLCSQGSRIVLVNGSWTGGIPGPMWWRTLSESGGQFVEQCTHVVDLARYIAGEIVEVSAFSTRGYVHDLPGYTVDDAMVVNARFASGAIGNFTTACHMQGFGEVGLKLSTRTIQCSLSGWAMDLKVEQNNQPAEEQKSDEDIFALQNEVFLQAVKDGNPSLIRSDYADAVATLRVTLAANESAKSGRMIQL